MHRRQFCRFTLAVGPAYPRLQQVKTKYDPRNLFRLNNNVQPVA